MLRVLSVDDEAIFRQGFRSLVDWEKLGYAIAGDVESAKDALEFIQRDAPDVIITDIRIPEMDGLEFIRQAKRTGAAQAAFIIISAYDEFQYAQKALEYGVKGYMLKPVDENELTELLIRIRQERDGTYDKGTLTDKVDAYITEHMSEALSIQTIAQAMFLNAAYLGRVYKTQKGITITQRIAELRIAEAKSLLRQTDMYVYEIAKAVGCTDANYFSVLFEKVSGCSPTQYRADALSQSCETKENS